MKNHHSLPLVPFYFIRHGETDWNKRQIVMGSIDIPLNQVGITQAHEVSCILENENFDIIISSPRIRAQQTAEIIRQKTHKPMRLEPNLTERIWGEAEGKPFDPTKDLFNDAHTPQGAETFTVFQRRIIETLTSLLSLEKCPLLVSHGGVFKVIAHYFGYTNLNSFNCTPFFFKPPNKPSDSWSMIHLGIEKISSWE